MIILIDSQKFGIKTVEIDDSDCELISGYKFHVHKGKRTFYARGFKSKSEPQVFMHNLLIKDRVGIIDHIDNNGLNNKRSNLRVVTNKQNSQNQRLAKNNTTGFKGVSYRASKGLYFTCIRLNGKLISGGVHKNVLMAANKYNEMSEIHFGEFAKKNQFTDAQLLEIKNYKKEPRRAYGTVNPQKNK